MTTRTTIRSALIVEGGAMRSVFSAGLLDAFIQQEFYPFDFHIGVSGGACNLLAYLYKQRGKSLTLYLQAARHQQFINYWRFITGGQLIDINWLTGFIFSDCGIGPVNKPLIDKPFYIATTDVATGEAILLKTNEENLRPVLTASMSLPLLTGKFPMVNGRPNTDGGVAANIPIAEAIQMGANRIMIVRARPRTFIKHDTVWHRLIRFKLRRFPQLVQKMSERVALHQKTIDLIRNPPQGIKIVDICPPESFTADRFTRCPRQLQQGYDAGKETANDAIEKWRRYEQ